MANKIYIEYKKLSTDDAGENASLSILSEAPLEIALTQDVVIQAQSEWQSLGDFIPDFLGKALSFMSTASALGGTISTGLADMMNKLEVPFWKKTPPVKIQTTLGFFTKTDSYLDVVYPVTKLVGLSILTREEGGTGRYILPGINLKNLSRFTSAGSASEINVSKNSKLISLEIPGIIYLPIAMIEAAIPTFSNEITESGNPLWATVDVSFMGVAPASTDMFESALLAPNKTTDKQRFQRAKTKSMFD